MERPKSILPSAVVLPFAPLPSSSELPTTNEDRLKATIKNIEEQRQAVHSNILAQILSRTTHLDSLPPPHSARSTTLIAADNAALVSDRRPPSATTVPEPSARSSTHTPTWAPTPPVISAVKNALAAWEEYDRSSGRMKARLEEELRTEERLRRASVGWGPRVSAGGEGADSSGGVSAGVGTGMGMGMGTGTGTGGGGMGVDSSRDPRRIGR
ncbi:hypothetical protein EV356DRAFT_507564 [Viridothelium virens]|uniref:Uncharacterized protein n=1 Tax=Viridothelium virens TaxID=1048519 RepID=A0A6A6HJW4_VIRVR|nr:hypothetical protein EV356DRAFT_507564 [Viridothelium virens]